VSEPGQESEAGVRFVAQVQLDRTISNLAAGQHGVVALEQLKQLGLSARAVQLRAASGRLHRVHRGVYALTPPKLIPLHGRWLAAVLACGDGAVLSHRDAAALHNLRPSSTPLIDVTLPGRSRGRHPGLRLHRSISLNPDELTTVHGIPCTGVSRTLLDLAGVVSRRQTELALDRMAREQMTDRVPLATVLARNPNTKGARQIRSILDEHELGSTLTESDLEEPFFALIRGAGLPLPQVNYYIDPGDGGLLVKGDFVWIEQRLVVETDSQKYHGTLRAFESDRIRDQRLVAAGWRVIRITGWQVEHTPGEVIALLIRLL
jgi:hypothetical protein